MSFTGITISTLTAVKILPLYLPPVEWLLGLRQATSVFVDLNSNWKKQTLRNRTTILSANGIQTLTVPVVHTGGKTVAIKDIRICYQNAWRRVHKGALFSAYNTSPFFEYFREELFHTLDRQPVFLIDLNLRLLELILQKLKCQIPIQEFNSQHINFDLTPYDSLNELQEKMPPYPEYPQVFGYKYPYQPFLSVIDVLSNKGSW